MVTNNAQRKGLANIPKETVMTEYAPLSNAVVSIFSSAAEAYQNATASYPAWWKIATVVWFMVCMLIPSMYRKK